MTGADAGWVALPKIGGEVLPDVRAQLIGRTTGRTARRTGTRRTGGEDAPRGTGGTGGEVQSEDAGRRTVAEPAFLVWVIIWVIIIFGATA